jgi:ribonuclease G
LPWFRRRARKSENVSSTETPVESKESRTTAVTADPARAESPADADGSQAARRRRRRGSRGGKGRKRTTTQTAEAVAEPDGTANGAGTKTAKQQEKPRPARGGAQSKTAKPRSRRSEPRRRQQARKPLPAAKRELLVSVNVSEQRVAVLEDDRVAEVYLERPGRRSIAGNVYKGVVDNVLPGMEAAFVEIGLEKNGFLYVDEIVGPELEGRSRHGRRIQDLISRGQEILVQAVKDPMKTKGARLTTEISLPGRFVVYVPQGEGIGVSRRLDDDERARLRDILKKLDLPKGGVIVRTAAQGASAEDVERDIRFLEKIWKEIQTRAKKAPAPSLIYNEAELPLRVVRDLFTGDFEKALVDDDLTFKRIVGYLKKTSPHMAERVVRYREKEPLFEAYGVDAEIRSTLSRRVDLPSGGYLVFDYAEAFTVIDVNTGRFVGSRSKSSGARLEDTITKNNLEAVKEVVRQLRLRDIGGIIVIDFIDMANPRNREQVEEELKQELERDRTKTYVVEISPLGLVEMTRQNVTDGPREILTKRCPTCAGDGIVVSETSVAVEDERRLRALAAQSPRTKAFKVELNAHVAAMLIGPGAERLKQIEVSTKRVFLVEGKEGVPLDHFTVLDKGTVDRLAPKSDYTEGQELDVKLGELALHDSGAAMAKLGGFEVCVGGAAKLVGKKVKVRVERVIGETIYASLAAAPKADAGPVPITAEGLAEKPTRASTKRGAAEPAPEVETEAVAEPEPEEPVDAEADPEIEDEAEVEGTGDESAEPAAPRKRTRRGSRGGRRRRKPVAAAAADGDEPQSAELEPGEAAPESGDEEAGPRIHLPDPSLGVEEAEEPSENGATPARRRRSRSRRRGSGQGTQVATEDAPAPEEPAQEQEPETGDAPAEGEPKRKKTRRGSRGGRRRRKTPAATTETTPE